MTVKDTDSNDRCDSEERVPPQEISILEYTARSHVNAATVSIEEYTHYALLHAQ